jgi:hypothetical protein
MLPAHLAAQFELRSTPRHTQVALDAFQRIYRRVPRSVRDMPARAEAERRIDGRSPGWLAGWVERGLFALAQRATGSPP